MGNSNQKDKSVDTNVQVNNNVIVGGTSDIFEIRVMMYLMTTIKILEFLIFFFYKTHFRTIKKRYDKPISPGQPESVFGKRKY